MTFSCPSFLAAATRPFIPPNAATEVAVASALVLELEELEPFDELLPHPAANSTPPTVMAAATVLILGTCSPSDLRGHWPASAPRWRERGNRRGES